MKTIRSSLLTLIAALIILQSSEAMALYLFNVKVVNKTGQATEVNYIAYKAKGNPAIKGCSNDDVVYICWILNRKTSMRSRFPKMAKANNGSYHL